MTARRVAFVHDWLTGVRGGEKVLRHLARRYPDAPVYTLFAAPGIAEQVVPGHPVHTSWLQRVPGIIDRYRSLLPLFPHAVRSLHVEPCDLVISTSHCVAKSVRAPADAFHLCYCFTPMRYVWSMRDSYFHRSRWKATAAAPVLNALRAWDRRTASGVDRFVAISRHVADRIRVAYDRDADVVHPPIEIDRIPPPEPGVVGDRFLAVSALVPYKRIDLAIDAFAQLDMPLDIIGAGGEEARLRDAAPDNVRLLGWRADDEVIAAYRSCRALVFPGEEDLGLVPLEAQLAGRPVVAYGVGGATETVRDGVTGVLFQPQEASALAAAVRTADTAEWDPTAIRNWALGFGPDRFDREFDACLPS